MNQHVSDVDLTPMQAVVAADDLTIPDTVAVGSVFDLAFASRSLVLWRPAGDHRQRAPVPIRHVPRCVSRNEVERRAVYAGACYPADRWTAEDAEKELQRRARQVVPPPPKQRFRMRGSISADAGFCPPLADIANCLPEAVSEARN